MDNIVIATIKEWNIKNYFTLKDKYPNKYKFHLLTSSEELKKEFLETIKPKYIFFPHWSWLIPQEIYERYECIVFHMTDLPFGRGGSPFQNLISKGIYDTKISALKVEEGIDTGDIYLKEPFNISIGSVEENLIKMSQVIFQKMIPYILGNNPLPVKQKGKVVNFARRLPKQSDMNSLTEATLVKLYDFIRMLDGEGYPRAYLLFKGLKIEFSEVHLKNDKLTGRFEVFEDE